jgi:gamma-glutamyltranspeptidase/glutathione hydrolase
MVVPPGVAAGHSATVEAGIRALRMGGTAADAAVAATLGSCVAESIFTGLGGGGFATYYDAASREVTCLDFFCATPGLDGGPSAGPMRPVTIRFGQVDIPYGIGGPSVAVPGVAAGCGEIHSRWGRLPWPDVVAPAISIAASGVPMPAAHAHTLPALAPAMLLDQGGPVYAPGGKILTAGDHLFHPGLASALTLLAERGPDVLYTGELGRMWADLTRADGGTVGTADLASYKVRQLPVQAAPLGDYLVFGRDDLNQAIAAIAALPANLSTMDGPQRAIALATVLGGTTQGLGDTTNVTAVDSEGNACVVTTTLGLGAGLWLNNYGVHLNSMLGETELIIGEPKPGQRISSMMCPMIVVDSAGRLVLAAGSAGASRIRSALLTTLVGTLIDGLSVTEAVRAPRLHPAGNVINLEPGYPPESANALRDAGFAVDQWTEKSHYFGGVSAIGTSGASGDPRRDGSASLL